MVFAGVETLDLTETGGVWSLPSALADFYAEDSIGTFTIKGMMSGKTPILSFINSNIASFKLGTINLAYADGSNGGVPFGVACTQYGTLNYLDVTDPMD